MAEKIEFVIKEKSILEFFNTYCASFKEEARNRDINPYYIFKDEIILSKNVYSFLNGQGIKRHLVFEFSDRGRVSDRELINTYFYEIETYDLVSVKLTLIDFQIKSKIKYEGIV